MLAHQLRALPDFDHFWAEVPHIFAWLHGEESIEELKPAPLNEDEEFWTPPLTFWESGPGSLLEPVRFAAVNRLLVDLGYNGRHRLNRAIFTEANESWQHPLPCHPCRQWREPGIPA